MNKIFQEPSSFRDPSGTVFYVDDKIYRKINLSYTDNYEALIQTGLYEKLSQSNMLVCHTESNLNLHDETVYRVIEPERIPFISYPYEWCFSQLKDAALLTLEIQKIAIEYQMSLKDCSAYNIQFRKGKPILIDTLSFEHYQEGKPWVAYRQFCQHFLGPLALMAFKDPRLNQLSKIHIDGIPLDLVSKLLPKTSFFNFSNLSHIHLHSKSLKHYEKIDENKKKEYRLRKNSLIGIVESLHNGIKKMKLNIDKTEWSNYYSETNYDDTSFNHKQEIITKFIEKIMPKSLWDFGANTGFFSRIASKKGILTISFDYDILAIEKNYLESIKNNDEKILPLVVDLSNPSPSIGWNNNERKTLAERGPVDLIMALALIHHLAISNNLPFDMIASYFSNLCTHLIIEFVPKEDSQVQKLLSVREDTFPYYTQQNFEDSFKEFFKIIEVIKLHNSHRILFLMQRK